MNAKKLYFRNGVTLANISAIDSQIRLFGATGTPLGQLSSAPEKSCLLATDEAHSILGAKNPLDFQTTQYSAYGLSAAEKQATALGYNGELLDPFDSYLLGHGNRAYSTRLMRFLSPDKIGVFSGNNFNAYAYAAGDPINYSDPSGNIPEWIKPALRFLRLIGPEGTKNYKSDLATLKNLEQGIRSARNKLNSIKNDIRPEINHIESVGHRFSIYPAQKGAENLDLKFVTFSDNLTENYGLAPMYVKCTLQYRILSPQDRIKELEANKIVQDKLIYAYENVATNINNKIRKYETKHPNWIIKS